MTSNRINFLARVIFSFIFAPYGAAAREQFSRISSAHFQARFILYVENARHFVYQALLTKEEGSNACAIEGGAGCGPNIMKRQG
jgi:hypothetical protein